MATELYVMFGRDLALTLTPVAGGRFEVYLNERKLWDRKEAPGRPYPSLAVVHDLQEIIAGELEALPAESSG